ncbi:hypothetical protein AAC387_Pa02g1352 [Persea americana]|eukprot:TRINITY_DN33763_c1_g1_i1.p1 TRINITY_DN33763_c1_g1~~TRINITY_DN33763_c1_g1_i1.p1  ORF type:complete len:110 (+),score=11.86 TRINITY_DN33763_c1_g1_i1:47-331(+)
MALRALLLVAVVLFFVSEVSSRSILQTNGTAEIDCDGLCAVRCSLHSRPNRCARACGTCCLRCKCVPPGTSGNREACGVCYTGMTTHRNQTKCP